MYTIYIIFVYNNGINRLNIFTWVVYLYLVILLILNISCGSIDLKNHALSFH